VNDPVTGSARVEWEDRPTAHKAGDLLSQMNNAERDEQNEAERWLVDYLTERGGTAGAGEAIKAAARDGIARAILDRARRRAGIQSSKSGMGAGWVWTLPGPAAEEPTKNPKNSTPGDPGSSGSSGAGVSSSEPQVSPAEASCLWCVNPIPIGQHYCSRLCAEADRVDVTSQLPTESEA
jgi:hypothetical protein